MIKRDYPIPLKHEAIDLNAKDAGDIKQID